MFPLDQPISEESGRKIAIWAAGGAIIDDTTRHLKALESADTLDKLKTAFEAAYTSSKAKDVRDRFKAAYDARKGALGDATSQ